MFFFFTPMLARLTLLVLGTLYPAYASFKAVKNKSSREYVRWMMYWIVFAIFLFCEAFFDFFLYYLPFYHELKILLIVWLMAPYTRGSSVLYRRIVHPYLLDHERDIDNMLDRVRSRGFVMMKDLGAKGLQTANQMIVAGIKNSMSLGDISSVDGALRLLGGGNPATVRRQHMLQHQRSNGALLPVLSEDEGEFEQQQRLGSGSGAGQQHRDEVSGMQAHATVTLPRSAARTAKSLSSSQQQPARRAAAMVAEKLITVEVHHEEHGGGHGSDNLLLNGHHARISANGHADADHNNNAAHDDDADADEETDNTWHTSDTSANTSASNTSSGDIEVVEPVPSTLSLSSRPASLGLRPPINESRNRNKHSGATVAGAEILPNITATRTTRSRAAANAVRGTGRSSSSGGRV